MSEIPVRLPPGVKLLHPDSVPERNGVAATLSHTSKNGEWVLPRHFRALALLGEVDLDLTQVVLGAGESEIEAVAILGSVKIVVPSGIQVDCDGDATFGAFEMKGGSGYPVEGAPVLRITGSAFMGSVTVQMLSSSERGWLETFLDR